MKRCVFIVMVTFLSLALLSCSSTKKKINPYMNLDLSRETWPGEIATDPNPWRKGADVWFFTGDPNPTELSIRHAPPSASVSTMMVQAAEFTKIEVNGNFQVQIFNSNNEPNSVYVYGPNAGVRETTIDTKNGTLYVGQANRTSQYTMNNVIVRIGVRQLHSITQKGGGTIEAIHMCSNRLNIVSTPSSSGHVFVSGNNINVQRIDKAGRGNITIFGANTPCLKITTSGMGHVNIVGNVGVRSIVHHGMVNVNIMGANSNYLTINADGAGKIGIDGRVCLKEVIASGNVCVFVRSTMSETLKVFICQQAKVGISGFVRNLYVDAYGMSIFWGRYLCADNAYASAYDVAHINVAGNFKIYASARQNASISVYGPLDILTPFTKDDGRVIPFGASKTVCLCRPQNVLVGPPITPRRKPILRPPCKRKKPIYVGAG